MAVSTYVDDQLCSLKDQVQEAHRQSQEQTTPRPSNPANPSAPFSSYSGVYWNLGYGDVELCSVSVKSKDSSTSTCKDVVSSASTLLPGALDDTIPTFLVKWDKFWFSHLKLEHFDTDMFNASLLDSRVSLTKVKRNKRRGLI